MVRWLFRSPRLDVNPGPHGFVRQRLGGPDVIYAPADVALPHAPPGGPPGEQPLVGGIERAADVMLKEQRRLVIVPRETPMSLPQLRNMVLCAEAGAMVMPAMPAFYHLPKTLDDLADFIAGKILSLLCVEHHLYPSWSGQVER